MTSRQLEWQRRAVAEGRCRACGGPRDAFSTRCAPCREKNRRQARKRLGLRPREESGLGRPLLGEAPLGPVRVRASREEKEAWAAAALASGMGRSEWMRVAANRAAGREAP